MASSDPGGRPRRPDALYYPFHLCHERTLHRLLADYARVHFRDYMALRLTPMHGTTAYADRMGDSFPDLVKAGRLVQGHDVSGPLDDALSAAIDRDWADPDWRTLFHRALSEDRRFQRGLFDLAHAVRLGPALVPGPAALLELLAEERRTDPYTVATLRRDASRSLSEADGYRYEYGLALLKTAAALRHTIRLARGHDLDAVTDSAPHAALLDHTCRREGIALTNRLYEREGY